MPGEFDPSAFLGPDGPVARSLSSYETRPQQIDMARAVYDCLGSGRHLLIEAGTGVGKSFAYLGAALAISQRENKPVLISTSTINLQEQLIHKDIPFLQECWDEQFVAVLAKGRQNYLCPRRLGQAVKKQGQLFSADHDIQQLDELYAWSLQTRDGSLSDIPFSPASGLWESVCSEAGSCSGSVCNRSSDCFYQRARRRLFKANLIIVNHALLFTDLAVKRQGGTILPSTPYIICDEAHNVESAAARHFGLRLSNRQIQYLLNRLWNSRTQKGMLAEKLDQNILRLHLGLEEAAEAFFRDWLQVYDQAYSSGSNGRIRQPDLVVNSLSDPLKYLADHLNDLAEAAETQEERLELVGMVQRCGELALAADALTRQSLEDSVYWVEARRQRRDATVTLCTGPLQVGPLLREVLYEPSHSVVYTSATLSLRGGAKQEKNEQGFAFYRQRLGAEDFDCQQLGSPFVHERQVCVYVEGRLPDPQKMSASFLEKGAETVKEYLLQTDGGALILFTSYSQLDKMGELLEPFCLERQMPLLLQGAGRTRQQLLDTFRQEHRSVLLGTDSFWQGVDVPGESLRNVIIVKLPFAVPDEPLLQARLERIRETGGNPFMDYQLPEAILKFKQGFGRLIRRATDKGIVVILDPRVLSKPYGRHFLQALPPCRIEYVR